MREIGAAVHLASTSSVAHQLMALERKGVLYRDPQRPRAYRVRPSWAPELGARSTDQVDVPLVGRIAIQRGSVQLSGSADDDSLHDTCGAIAESGEPAAAPCCTWRSLTDLPPTGLAMTVQRFRLGGIPVRASSCWD